MSLQHDFIEFALDTKVLRFGEFKTKAGRLSPYFFNLGLFNTGSTLARLADFYAKTLLAARERGEIEFDMIFGPAYKGIPLAAAVAVKLAEMGCDIPYAFNRKEAKDHGEGGVIVGKKFQDREKIAIIEDVITAGTAIRAVLPLLKSQADVDITALIISVDRMERGQGEKSALTEISEKYGMKTTAIVTMAEVVEHLYNKPYKGKVIIDDELKKAIDAYYDQYGVK